MPGLVACPGRPGARSGVPRVCGTRPADGGQGRFRDGFGPGAGRGPAGVELPVALRTPGARRRCGGREEGCGRAGLWCRECRRRGRRVCARRGVGSSGDRPLGAGGGGDGRPAGRGEIGGCAGRRRLRGGARGPVQDGALGAGPESAGPLRRPRGLCTVPSLPCRPLPGVGSGPARRGMRVRPAHPRMPGSVGRVGSMRYNLP